jgi:hypothetical protein
VDTRVSKTPIIDKLALVLIVLAWLLAIAACVGALPWLK